MRVLLFDIETAPLQGVFWSMWKQNIGYNQLFDEWYMLTWAAKWLDEPEESFLYDSLHLHGDMYDDEPIVKSLHALIDEADVVVAHNGDRFDIKKINTRFLHHGLSPPSPYKSVDTLKIAKNHFAFTSNRLDALGEFLGLGRKIDTGGMDLWMRCLQGDEAAFVEMAEYNVQDIRLLESVYLALLPWAKNHPNVGVYYAEEGHTELCSKCGSEDIQRRGFSYTQVSKLQRYQCNTCGGWTQGRTNLLTKEEREGLLKP